jgi:hypothetical protein
VELADSKGEASTREEPESESEASRREDPARDDPERDDPEREGSERDSAAPRRDDSEGESAAPRKEEPEREDPERDSAAPRKEDSNREDAKGEQASPSRDDAKRVDPEKEDPDPKGEPAAPSREDGKRRDPEKEDPDPEKEDPDHKRESAAPKKDLSMDRMTNRATHMDYEELIWHQVEFTSDTLLPGYHHSRASLAVTFGGVLVALVWFVIYFGYIYRSDRNEDWAARDKIKEHPAWRPHDGPFIAEIDQEEAITRHLDIRPDMCIIFPHPNFDSPDKHEVVDIEDVTGVFVQGMTSSATTEKQRAASRSSRAKMETYLPRTKYTISQGRPRKEVDIIETGSVSCWDAMFATKDELAVGLDDIRTSLLHDLYEALLAWGFDVLVFSSIDRDEMFLCVSLQSDATLYHYLEAFHTKLQIQSVIAPRLGIDFSGWEKEAASSPPYLRFDHTFVENLHNTKAVRGKFKASKMQAEEAEEEEARTGTMPMEQDKGKTQNSDKTVSIDPVGSTTHVGDTFLGAGVSAEASWAKATGSAGEGKGEGTREAGEDNVKRVLPDIDPRHLWRTYHGGKHEGGCIVDSKERLLIIYRELTNHIDLNGAKALGIIKDWYPVHSKTWISKLRADWARLVLLRDLTFVQPVTVLQEYFGPRLAFRFAWSGVYCKSLLALVPLALLCESSAFFAKTWFNVNGVDRMVIASFNIVTIIWAKIAFNLWEREESFFAALWGLEDGTHIDSSRQLIRPSFIGSLSHAEHDRTELEKVYPAPMLLLRKCCTFGVTMLFCTVVWLLMAFWYTLYHGRLDLVASIMLCLQIKIFEAIWNSIAPWLTEFENHKYPNDFYNSYLWKLFLFQAINSYAAFFYTAVQPTAGCPQEGCLFYLRTQLIIIQIVLSVSHMASIVFQVHKVDFLLWYENLQLRVSAGTTTMSEEVTHEASLALERGFSSKTVGHASSSHVMRKEGLPERSYAEEQGKHVEFGDRQQIEAMCMLMISLGCIIIFGAVAPIIVPFCLIVFALELRFTSHVLATHAKRPLPERRLGIGAWKNVLSVVMKVGVAFSGYLLVTYSDTFRHTRPLTKVSGAVGFCILSLLAWELVNIFWPPKDPTVQVLDGRRARVERKIRQACMMEAFQHSIKPRRDASGTHNAATREMRYADIQPLHAMKPSDVDVLYDDGTSTEGDQPAMRISYPMMSPNVMTRVDLASELQRLQDQDLDEDTQGGTSTSTK